MEGNYWQGYGYGEDTLQRVAIKIYNDDSPAGGGRQLKFNFHFSINPSSMQYNYPARNIVVQTLGRHAGMQGYGQGVHTIQISGQTGFNQKGIMQEGPVGKDTDYGRARKLRHILMYETNRGHDDFHNSAATPSDMTTMYFCNYTDGMSFQVELSPQGVQFSRTNQDPLTYYYSITMTVIRVAQNPTPYEYTKVELGNYDSFLNLKPYTIRPHTKGTRPRGIAFNTKYHHPLVPIRPIHDLYHGKRSIADNNPLINIKALENKNNSNPVPLSDGQKAGILAACQRKPKTIPIVDNGHHLFNVKIGTNPSPARNAFWNKWIKGSGKYNHNKGLPLSNIVNRYTLNSKQSKALPLSNIVDKRNDNNPFTPSLNRNGVITYEPVDNFKRDKAFNPNDPRRYYENTADDKPAVNPDLNKRSVTSQAIYDDNAWTVHPLYFGLEDANTPANSALTTLAQQGKILTIEPNTFDHETPLPTSNSKSDCYVQFFVEHHPDKDDLILIGKNGQKYHTPDDKYTLYNADNTLHIINHAPVQYLLHNADNWAKVSVKDHGVNVSASKPNQFDGVNYYQHNINGSHAEYDGRYMIVPNRLTNRAYRKSKPISIKGLGNKKEPVGNVIDTLSKYNGDVDNDLPYQKINQKGRKFHIKLPTAGSKLKIDLTNYNSNDSYNDPNVIDTPTADKTIQTPGDDDNE